MTVSKLLLLFLLIILSTLNYVNNTEIPLASIKKNVTSTAKIIKLNLESTRNDILTTAYNLQYIIPIDNTVKILNSFNSILQQISTDNQSTIINTINTPISDVLNAIKTIQSAVLNALPLLKNTTDGLTDTISYLDSLLSVSSGELTDIANKLQSALNDALTLLDEVSDVVFTDLADIIQPNVAQFNNATTSIRNILSNNGTPSLIQLSQDENISYINLLMDLLNIQQAFDELVQFILGQIFSLISTITDATEGLLVPLVSTTTGTLHQMAECPECFNRTLPTHTRHYKPKSKTETIQ